MGHVNSLLPAAQSFGRSLRELRLRVNAKQIWLSYEIGCTEAAISFWERGRRIPTEDMLVRLLAAFQKSGVLPEQISALQVSWREAILTTRRRCPVVLPPLPTEDLRDSA
jgi:transcriptional regulator with XRE-family HTH domain